MVEVRDPYTTGASDLLADDGRGASWSRWASTRPSTTTRRCASPTTSRPSCGRSPCRRCWSGELLAEEAFGEQAVQDAARGEGIALVVLLVVLVVVLGGWVVGAIPVVTALGAVAASLLCLGGLVTVAPVSEYAVNVVTLLGLGLAVDYTLLVVARFREERARAGRRTGLAQVLGRTTATAGRTVLVSGLTGVPRWRASSSWATRCSPAWRSAGWWRSRSRPPPA